MPPRPPELRPYRVAIYVAYSLLSALACVLILRSVMGDLFGRAIPGAGRPATAGACLDDVDRLFAQLSARVVQPGGLGGGAPERALDWDRFSRGWEDELAAVSQRCRLSQPEEETGTHLAAALEGLESLRREVGRSGEETGRESRRVKEELSAARKSIKR